MLNYDAINLGERDFLQGTKYLLDAKKELDLPFISANVYYPDSTTRFTEPYIIKKFKAKRYGDIKVSGVTVGIFGVLMRRHTLIYQKDEPRLVTTDPFKAAAVVVEELKQKCDVIIALAHMSSSQINKLLDNVSGIDVVIGGHDYMRRANSANAQNVMVVQTGTKGQYLGDTMVNLDKDKKVVSSNGQIMTLDKTIKNDPEINELVAEFKKENQKNTKDHASGH